MRKPEKSIKKRKAAAKRGEKRSLRLKKTQTEKGLKKAKFEATKREKAKKYREAINKILQSKIKDAVQ